MKNNKGSSISNSSSSSSSSSNLFYIIEIYLVKSIIWIEVCHVILLNVEC